MRYQLVIHGGYNPEYRHFTNATDLARWLVDETSGGILEVEVNEV